MYNVFISHNWYFHTEDYELLCSKLDPKFDSKWLDLSIPESRAIKIFNEGKASYDQEVKLIIEKMELCNDEIGSLKKTLEDVSQAIKEFHNKVTPENHIRRLESKLDDLSYYHDARKIESLRKEIDKFNKIKTAGNKPELIQVLSELEDRKNSIENKISIQNSKFYDLDRIYKKQIHFYRDHDFSFYKSHPYRIHSSSKGSNVQISFPKNLYDEIENRVIKADIVIFIVGLFSDYRKWVDCEHRIAMNHRKEIYAISSLSQERESLNIEYFSNRELDWNELKFDFEG